MYEGVHNLHHAKTLLRHRRRSRISAAGADEAVDAAGVHVAAALAPIGLLIRFGVLAPLSLLSPKLRELVVGRYSGLQINPEFRRRPPEGDFARRLALAGGGGSVWAIALIAHGRDRHLPLRAFLIFLRCRFGRRCSSTRCGRSSRICGRMTARR